MKEQKYVLNQSALLSLPVTPSTMDEAMSMSLDGSSNDYYSVMAYGSIYQKVTQKLRDVITKVDKVASISITEVITSQFADDALSPRVADDDIFKYSVNSNDIIQKELNTLHMRLGLNQLIENITPDLINYGEYTLSTEIEGQVETANELTPESTKKVKSKKSGIVDVRDDVEQGTVIALTQDGILEGYLQTNPMTGRIERREVADFVKFTLGGQRVKVDTKAIIPTGALSDPRYYKLFKSLPRFIRVGKSMLYAHLEKIEQLHLLEQMSTALKINAIAKGNIIGLPLPSNYDLEKAKKTAEHFEGILNKKVSVDPASGEITVANLLSTAGKSRVVPLLGDKGNLQSIDAKSDEPDNLAQETVDLRKLILDSIGMPSELIFGSDGDSKGEVLKRNAKYTRKLRRIQKALAEGLRNLAFIHLRNKEIKFKRSDITVTFNKTLVDIENLDQIERDEATISGLSTVKDFIFGLAEEGSPLEKSVDLQVFAKYVDDTLTTIGLPDIIKSEVKVSDVVPVEGDNEEA